ncbi:CidA/LrgA family protein [Pseudoroseomonas wenyumeiae]|uniref:CidA/LrgA family protein n=1 Tax=Teichococcus wenyumeiae TaxID=2478470 RepID=A0A3A9JJP8_9PROT|nr:CidA/LrgA family protein [Pseudoroseomonas wenyumeiae]RKK03986.1 CidA/LrgA family protein [Pseudoroseomonas wenyumeiae]RMI20670.1 CidA/LrgA family protein [Pseudoroseomonas wenyumeiae]
MTGAITALLVCQLIGEVLARVLHLPVPGPVIGMVLLFLALLLRYPEGEPPEALGKVADTLLGNLGLLFVPAGVGVVVLLHTLAQNWLSLMLAIVGGTLLAMVITGRLAQALLRRWG